MWPSATAARCRLSSPSIQTFWRQCLFTLGVHQLSLADGDTRAALSPFYCSFSWRTRGRAFRNCLTVSGTWALLSPLAPAQLDLEPPGAARDLLVLDIFLWMLRDCAALKKPSWKHSLWEFLFPSLCFFLSSPGGFTITNSGYVSRWLYYSPPGAKLIFTLWKFKDRVEDQANCQHHKDNL